MLGKIQKFIIKNQKALTKAVLGVFLATFALYPHLASAAALTTMSDTMSRLKVNTLSSHDILFNLGGSTAFDAGETITVDFNEDGGAFSVDGAASVAADFDFNDGTERTVNMGSCPAGANNVEIAVNDTTGVVTITACSTYTSSAAGATVNLEYGTAATTGGSGTNRVTNPNPGSPPVTYTIDIVAAGDTGKLAVVIIADDQIVYSATVDPTITMSVSSNTSSLGTLSVSSVSASTAVTLTISTNGESGCTVTMYDAGDATNPGLYKSASPTDLIGSSTAAYADGPTALSAGTEGYGIQAKTSGNGSGGTFTIGTRYNNDYDANNTVGGLEVGPSAAQTLATASAPINAREILMKAKAAIDGLNRSGSYQDTVTVIATGNF